MKPFPIQAQRTTSSKWLPPTEVSWEIAEIAYSAYSKRFGTSQSLERLAERAGFGLVEFALLLLDACGHNVDLFNGTVTRGSIPTPFGPTPLKIPGLDT